MEAANHFAQVPTTPEPIIAQIRRQLTDDPQFRSTVPAPVLARLAAPPQVRRGHARLAGGASPGATGSVISSAHQRDSEQVRDTGEHQRSMNRLVVIEAPSNLGLSPPEPGSVPGVYKLAGALRDCQFPARIAASDEGVVVPPRYRADWDGRTVRNGAAIARYSRRLADRIVATLDGGGFPVVLGGDCSILLGAMIALRRRGRYGLVFVDGHLDFRHPGNSPYVRAVAGEDLALVTGRGASDLVDLEGLRPYVGETEVYALGARDADEYADEVRAAGIGLATVSGLRRIGFCRASEQAIARLQRQGVDGFWIHLDLDVVDAALLPAVDSPEPAGLAFDELCTLLVPLLASRLAVGLEVTIFDPDLDESGQQAAAVTDTLVAAFEASGRVAPRPASRPITDREPAPPRSVPPANLAEETSRTPGGGRTKSGHCQIQSRPWRCWHNWRGIWDRGNHWTRRHRRRSGSTAESTFLTGWGTNRRTWRKHAASHVMGARWIACFLSYVL